MQSSKEAMLNKIRNGLQHNPAPMPYPQAENNNDFIVAPHDSKAELFAASFTQLGGKFIYCTNEQEMIEQIVSLADFNGLKHVHCNEPYLVNKFKEADLTFTKTGENLEGLEAAVTFCKYGVARLGSLIINSDTPSGRALPVYTPVHICVVYHHQILTDLSDVFTALQHEYGNEWPSMVNIATGPSRTADIEKTLVVGVHGPKEVYVLFVDEIL
jgi:L-lactate dehydrogenase complex protein LldG